MREPIDTLVVAEALRRAKQEHPDPFEQLAHLRSLAESCGVNCEGESFFERYALLRATMPTRPVSAAER